MPGQMIHVSLALCSKDYYDKNIRQRFLRPANGVPEYKGPLKSGSKREILEHFGRYFNFLECSVENIEMVDSSSVSDTFERLRLASGNEKYVWAYRLTMATVSGFYSCFPTFW